MKLRGFCFGQLTLEVPLERVSRVFRQIEKQLTDCIAEAVLPLKPRIVHRLCDTVNPANNGIRFLQALAAVHNACFAGGANFVAGLAAQQQCVVGVPVLVALVAIKGIAFVTRGATSREQRPNVQPSGGTQRDVALATAVDALQQNARLTFSCA